MWCTKRRMEPYQEEVKPYNISSKELKQSEFLENSPVNEFCFERLDKNGTEVVTLTSDILTEKQLMILGTPFI